MLGLKLNTRQLLNKWAPPLSRRRKLLWRTKWFFVHLLHPMRMVRELRYGDTPWHFEDPYDSELLYQFFLRAGIKGFSSESGNPSESPASASRWILHQLLSNPEKRGEFRQPLREGIAGGFAQWLLSQVGEDAQAQANIKSVFAHPPGARLRSMYDEYTNWRDNFPIAFTPAGRGKFLHYLLVAARPFWKMEVEPILWFHFDNAEDEFQGLVATYQIQPEWQQGHPLALTPEGWDDFRYWLRKKYEIEGDWLENIPAPEIHTPEETHLLRRLVDPLPSSESPFGINVLAHFRYPSGLQEAAFNTVKALELSQIPHSKRDVPNNHMVDLPGREGYLDLELFDVSLSAIPPEPLGEHRFNHAGVWKRDGLYRIGLWYWELAKILPKWIDAGKHFQEIWAPTKFIRDAFQEVMSIPVIHMPPGIHFPQPTKLTRKDLGLPEKAFLFLFMFDMSSIFERKNPLAVVEAFRRAFGKSRDVRLVIKLSRGESDLPNLNKLRAACAEVDAILMDRVMSRTESYGLLENCDSYISLHRSEGYGLTMAEAMSYRKPVIATAFSGNLDFMTEQNSRLIPCEVVKLGKDYFPYPKEAVWANPCIELAAQEMRWVVEHPVEAKQLGEKAANDIRQHLSLEAYGERMRRRLEEILKR